MRRIGAPRTVSPMTWMVLPALAAVAGTLILAIPISLFGLHLPELVFPLVLAFAWPMIRPSMIAPVVLALLGLFLDLFWGGPIGLWPVALMAVYVVVLFSRNLLMGQSTGAMFAFYALSVLLAFAIAYGVTAAIAHNPPSLLATLGQMIPTLLLFPMANRLIAGLDDADLRFL